MKCIRCESFLYKENQYIDNENFIYVMHTDCMLEYMNKVINIIDEKTKISKEFRNKFRCNVYKK